MIPEPILEHKEDMARARRLHFFEKRTLVDVLESWGMDYLGRDDYANPPHCNVAQRVVTRLRAFWVSEHRGGNIEAFMKASRTEGIPKKLLEYEKEAMKAKNEDMDQ